MKRNFGGVQQNGPWTNQQMLERWGDDNTVYFVNVPNQLALFSQPLPLDMDQVGDGNGNRSFVENIFHVPQNQQATSFLCEETQTTTRTFVLSPGASAKVFVDAWKHYQTVPLLVTANGTNGEKVKYKWKFTNYVPIGAVVGDDSRLQGVGVTEGGAVCPTSTNQSAQTGLSAPIIRTLGHTNRSPSGEYPVTQTTKDRKCIPDCERPYLVFTNAERQTGPSLKVTIKVAQ